MTKTLDQHTNDWVENYSNLVAEGAISTGVNAGRDFFNRENLQGARYSAILDTKVCAYCRSLDGKTIRLDHPSYVSGEYDPPAHGHCRCVWVYISKKEKDVPFDWENPPPELKEKYAHWNEELPVALKKELWDMKKHIRNIVKEDLKALPKPIMGKKSELPWENSPKYIELAALMEKHFEKEFVGFDWQKEKLLDFYKWKDARVDDYYSRLEKIRENVLPGSHRLFRKYVRNWGETVFATADSKVMHVMANRLWGRPDYEGVMIEDEGSKKMVEKKIEKIDATGHNPALEFLLLEKALQKRLFAAAGIKELELYRGFYDEAGIMQSSAPLKGDISDFLQFRPLSSFTLDKGVAKGFGRVLFIEKVPVDEISFSFFTSDLLKSFAQDEVVVHKRNLSSRYVRVSDDLEYQAK